MLETYPAPIPILTLPSRAWDRATQQQTALRDTGRDKGKRDSTKRDSPTQGKAGKGYIRESGTRLCVMGMGKGGWEGMVL
jgi:hypothetical protein